MPFELTERALWTDNRRNDKKTATLHVDKYLTIVTMMMVVRYWWWRWWWLLDIDDDDDDNGDDDNDDNDYDECVNDDFYSKKYITQSSKIYWRS